MGRVKKTKKIRTKRRDLPKCRICGFDYCHIYDSVVGGSTHERCSNDFSHNHHFGLMLVKDGDKVYRYNINKDGKEIKEKATISMGRDSKIGKFVVAVFGDGFKFKVIHDKKDLALIMLRHALWSIGFEATKYGTRKKSKT